MKSMINKATRRYLETCARKGFPKTKNIYKEEEKGIRGGQGECLSVHRQEWQIGGPEKAAL
jgi:hypothetical protein